MARFTAQIYGTRRFARRIAVLNSLTPSVADLGFVEVRLGSARPQSASLAAGICALGVDHIAGIMVALADMPLLEVGHLDALLRAFDGDKPVCSSSGTMRSPPAIFPVSMYERLSGQVGDKGARALLADAVPVTARPMTLLDVDTPEDLEITVDLIRRRRSDYPHPATNEGDE